MKKILLLGIIILSLSSCFQKKVKISSPIVYNDSLVNVFLSVQDPMDSLMYFLYSLNIYLYNNSNQLFDSIDNNIDEYQILYKHVQNNVENSSNRLNKFEYTGDDFGYLESISVGIDSIGLILEENLGEMITMLENSNGKKAGEVSENILPIGKVAFRRYSALFLPVMKNQMTFNMKNKYSISENYIKYRF